MIFWIIVLIMLLAAILSVLLPLVRSKVSVVGDVDAMSVYRQQLLDIEKQEPSNETERENLASQRAEIARRLLRENKQASAKHIGSNASSRFSMSLALFCALLVLPAVSAVSYFSLGSPGVKDYPLSARAEEKLEDKSLDEMIQIAERHLGKNPDDARGWRVLADVYGRTNRARDRAKALEQIIRISGKSPQLLTDLGEALTVSEGNIVKDRARKMFEEALQGNPRLLKATVYLTLAKEQEGRFEDALSQWQILSKSRLDDKQWQEMTAGRIAAMQVKLGKQPSSSDAPGNPTQDDIRNAASLSSADRTEMIEGMVSGLAEKLKESPGNFAGWQRLVRSYMVLNRYDDAAEALQRAKSHFKSQPEKLSSLVELEKSIERPVVQKSPVDNAAKKKQKETQ